ncbi:hypothetical protein PILCRDRAFT_820542 [Piloderma croceum F 1598]|uniref:Uncharacterized protein n=1 Tax=Piloderma croceum (strain F 1598) TaxID=765440 RepID=A0A0C3B7G4_PILCF|nr:hypothetical protein PILCRDRAFT_820542 [Piloderma croceum F 1598]
MHCMISLWLGGRSYDQILCLPPLPKPYIHAIADISSYSISNIPNTAHNILLSFREIKQAHLQDHIPK